MTSNEKTARPRRKIVPGVLVALLVVLGLVFWRPIVAWFTLEPMGPKGDAIGTTAGGLRIEARLEPDPPREKGNTLELHVKDQDGEPVRDAEVEVEYSMPAMGAMPEMRGKADVKRKDGRFRAEFDLPMAGSWTLAVNIRSSAGAAEARYNLTVGAGGLTPAGGAPTHEGHGDEAGETAHYTCSMHPSVKQAQPGTCPICNMDLVPVTRDEQESGVIVVDEVRRQKIGVKTGRVVRRPVQLEVSALGKITYDETRLSDVTLKIDGWIRDLRVDEPGQLVEKGEVLFTLYSPELFAAQQEYLLASNSRLRKYGDRAEYLVKAAEQRLRLWDLTDAQIARIRETGRPLEAMPFLAPVRGYVIEKHVVEGAAVKAGERLYRIAGLDKVWVAAEVYEHDLPHVKVGQEVRISLPYMPGKSFTGAVSYIYPYLDDAKRTGKVRIELPNEDLALKPDMYANVTFQVDRGERLVVPSSAIVHTGPRRLVFLDLGEGRLRPEPVELGARTGEYYEVLDGLTEGQVVVTSGNFLVAAESRIRSAAAYWGGSDEAE